MKALFLDLDGTLADSLSVMQDVYMHFLKQFGHEGSETEFDRLNGPPLAEVVAFLKETYQLPGTVEALKRTYYAQVDKVYETVSPMAGAIELIEAARSQDMVLGLVTSNRRTLAEHWLERVGLFEAFTFLVTLEVIERGKPHPDAYLKALELAKVEASQAMAVEDSPQGACAARTACVKTYAFIHDPVIWTGQDLSGYHVIDHLDQVREELINVGK